MKNNNDLEIRIGYYGGLVCPNPREYYMMTRTYEQMKLEYDLLHLHEYSDEDLMKIAIINKKNDINLIITLSPIIFLTFIGMIFLRLYIG